MATPFKGYLASDGKPFEQEIDAVRHDLGLHLAKSFPELKRPLTDAATLDKLADIFTDYILLRDGYAGGKTTLEPGDHPETTLAPGEINVIVPDFYAFGRYQYHAAPDVTQVYFNGTPASQVRPGVWALEERGEEQA